MEVYNLITVTSNPLNPEEITNAVRDCGNGAIITFLGTTRELSEGKDVLYLEYEAYQPMAEAMLKQIVMEIQEK